MPSEEYDEIKDIPKQVIIDSFRKKIEEAKQELKEAIDRLNKIKKLTTGFE